MTARGVLTAFAVVLLTSSCGGEVAGSGADASADALETCAASSPSTGALWVLEEVAATLSVTCAQSGRYVTAVASAEVDTGCREPGPAYASRTGTLYDIHVFAWRHAGVACAASPVRTFQRPLRLEVLIGSSNRLVNRLSGSELTLPVAGSQVGCQLSSGLGRGADCSSDCDCAIGSECVPDTAAACSGKCQEPCGDNLDCSSGACVHDPSTVVSICEIGDCRASGNVECPKGMTCLCSSPPDSCLCQWKDTTPPRARPCAVDSDCPSPTECVEGGKCGRECGVRCVTSRMKCPDGSLCADAPRTDRPWTCEVIE